MVRELEQKKYKNFDTIEFFEEDLSINYTSSFGLKIDTMTKAFYARGSF
jgi:hypothetical protein